jgi:hypothetical protein
MMYTMRIDRNSPKSLLPKSLSFLNTAKEAELKAASKVLQTLQPTSTLSPKCAGLRLLLSLTLLPPHCSHVFPPLSLAYFLQCCTPPFFLLFSQIIMNSRVTLYIRLITEG